MAIGDPTAPEDNERAIGGNLRNTGGRRPRPGNVGRRVGPRLKLPAEFAQFRLADGRFLGEVMGDAFFGPASGSDGGEPIPEGVREQLREGNSQLPGITRKSAQYFAPPETAAWTVARGGADDGQTPGGDFEVEFTTLPYGPEEGDAPDIESDFPIAKRRPEGIGAALSGLDGDVPDVDPQAIADMDDAGLTGFAESMLDIEEIAALEPRTYDEYMRYASAIAKGAGMKGDELLGLASLLTSDENGMPRDLSGSDILPARTRKYYARFVEAALARRDTPLDLPRTTGGAVDMTLVQPGFVYKTGDGVLFMIDRDRKKFVEARRQPKPNAKGRLYETLPSPAAESVSIRDMMYRAKGRGAEVTHKIPTTADGKVIVRDLDKRVTYEVEDGRFFRFDADGERFREVYRDRETGAWLPLTEVEPFRLFDDELNIRPADDIEAEARALAHKAGVNVLLVMQIRGDASMLGHAEREIAMARAYAIIHNIPEAEYPRLLKWMAKYREVAGRLVERQQELMRKSAAALKGRTEPLSVEEMADRMDDPGVPENIMNAGIQGVSGSVLNIAENFNIAALRNIYDIQRNMDKIDEGANWTDLVGKNSAPDFVGSKIQMYATSKPAIKARLRKMYAVLPISEIPAFQRLDEARAWVAREFETNPRYKDSFGADRLPRAIGGAVPAVVVALLLKRHGVPFTAVGALAAAMTQGVADFNKSLKRGDSIETAFDKHRLGMWLGGVAELIPIPRVLSKTGDKSIANILLRAIELGGGAIGKEALLEKVSEALGNASNVSRDQEAETFTAKLDGKDVTFSKKALEYVLAVMTGLE